MKVMYERRAGLKSHGRDEEVGEMWLDAIRGLGWDLMYASWTSGAVCILDSGTSASIST